MPTTTPTPWKAEWYVGEIGIDHYYTEREIIGVTRRMNRRQTDHVTDEPILHRTNMRAVNVGQTIHNDRKCSACEKMYTPTVLHQKFCSTACRKNAQRAKERAQTDTAVAERIARMTRMDGAA